eukprot:scaffold123_cov106-Isochrysis_galbana.AAC.2
MQHHVHVSWRRGRGLGGGHGESQTLVHVTCHTLMRSAIARRTREHEEGTSSQRFPWGNPIPKGGAVSVGDKMRNLAATPT